MRLMRKHDPQLQEDGFQLLRPVAATFLPQLSDAYESELDGGLKRWLLELIASTGSEDAMPLLVGALDSPDESLRDCAVHGLETIDSRESRIALRRHRGQPIT